MTISIFPGRHFYYSLIALVFLISWVSPAANAAAVNDFETIDRHALLAPGYATQSVQALAAYLARRARSDQEKARAVYRWITQNINFDEDGSAAAAEAWEILKNRRADSSGSALLFKELALAAGLEVTQIRGVVRGFDFRHQDENGTMVHCWNAVKLEGHWQLLDASWGAGFFDRQSGRFVRRFEEHYFLTPPGRFIYDHFPDEPRWQLLEEPLSLEAFWRQVPLRPAFFTSGLVLKSHRLGRLQSGNHLVVELEGPPSAMLSARLQLGSRILPPQLVTIQRKADRGFQIDAIFPEPGEYELSLLVKEKPEDADSRLALRYTIEASSGLDEATQPLQPRQDFFDLGLLLDSHPFKLLTTDGELMVTFRSPGYVLLKARVFRNGVAMAENFTFTQERNGLYEVHASFPEPGRYQLRLYGRYRNDAVEYMELLDYKVNVRDGGGVATVYPASSDMYRMAQGYLREPFSGRLAAGQPRQFKLELAGAEKVAVVVSDQWFFLNSTMGVFSGTVMIGPGRIGIFAKFPGSNDYSDLLWFNGE